LTLIQKRWFSLRVVCGFFLFSLLLGGCAQNQPAKVTEPLVRHSSVHGGQQPVSGSTLQLYAVGTTGDGSAATALLTHAVTSDASGNFDITGTYTCPSPSALVYVTATGGNPGLSPGTNNAALALMAALGPCGNLGASTFISINELTTVAAVWSLAPFMSSYSSIGSGTGDASALASAFTLASQYVDTTTGTAPGLNVPAGTTVPVAQLNTLADILSSCVNSAGGVAGDGSVCGTLFAAATASGGTAPVEVTGAGLNIANHPTTNVSTLFGLVTATAPFQPMVAVVPADLTVGLAAPAGLVVSFNTLTFPAAYPGFPSAPQALILTNAGAQPITLSLLGFYGVDKGDFSMTSNQCTVSPYLFSGESCTIQITFTPSAVGARNASLSIGSSAPNSPVQVPLTGTGQPDSGSPLVFSPLSLDFTKAGVSQDVIVTNNGASPIAIGPITSSIAFSTNNCGTTMASGSSCTLSVAAKSIGSTVQTGTLSVTTSSTAGVQAIPFQVEVSPLPGLGFTAVSATFGTWAVGVTSSPYVGVNNLTGASVTHYPTVVLVGPNAADFSFLNVGPFTGGANGYGCYNTFCEANITFTPSGTGLRTATMQTAMGDVQLSGIGIPDGPSFVLRFESLIPPTVVGKSSSPTLVDLTNNGSTSISQTPTITGANASDFSMPHPSNLSLCGSSVASGTVCSFAVVFTPSQVGTRTATLTVTDSISGISQAIALTAIGEP
jgi:hypothetical protein